MDEIRTIFGNVLSAVNQGNPIALLIAVGLTALTEVGIPTFGLIDAILLYVGFQFGLLSLRSLMVIALLTLGRLIGSSAIYWPSRIHGQSFIKWLEKRFPALCARINRAVSRLNRKQAVAMVIIRFTPGLLTAGSVAAGMLKIKNQNFLLGVAIHAILADVILILIGNLGKYGISLAGIHLNHWQVFGAAIVLVLAFSVGLLIYQRIRTRRKRDMVKTCDTLDIDK